MKKVILSILPVFALSVFSACDDDARTKTGCGMELKLIETRPTGDLIDAAPLSGEDMQWQESIILWHNSTFIKQLERDGVTTSEEGTYTYLTADGRNFIELTYSNPQNALIESCTTAESTERIQVISATELHGSWGECDGPTLVYSKRPYNCED